MIDSADLWLAWGSLLLAMAGGVWTFRGMFGRMESTQAVLAAEVAHLATEVRKLGDTNMVLANAFDDLRQRVTRLEAGSDGGK